MPKACQLISQARVQFKLVGTKKKKKLGDIFLRIPKYPGERAKNPLGYYWMCVNLAPSLCGNVITR